MIRLVNLEILINIGDFSNILATPLKIAWPAGWHGEEALSISPLRCAHFQEIYRHYFIAGFGGAPPLMILPRKLQLFRRRFNGSFNAHAERCALA